MQLSGCTEKCKAGNSLKNGARSGREWTGREAKSPRGKEAEKKGTEKKRTERREAGNSRLRVRERPEAKRRAERKEAQRKGITETRPKIYRW